MALDGPYRFIIVESFLPASTSGLHGLVHVRPARFQIFSQDLHVECSRVLVNTENYPVGTKFRIKVKLTDLQGGGEYLYSYHGWPFDVVSDDEFARLNPKKRQKKAKAISKKGA